ncbi:MAG: polymer-forming cytoskeletal protein [Gemmatimonadota bacterium]
MARDRNPTGSPPESVISIIGPGMKVVGDCETEGTIRIEGVVEGSVRAGKAVVVGRDGLVKGDIRTQDAVISGRVDGTLIAESRLELQASCRIDGTVYARRMQLEEGAILNGTVDMGDVPVASDSGKGGAAAQGAEGSEESGAGEVEGDAGGASS